MPRQFARKPFAGRRAKRSGQSHWLEQGADGQEALIFDVDPYQLAVDQQLCSRITQLSFRLRSEQDTFRSLLLPKAGAAGWHTPYLTKNFEVYLCGLEYDPLVESAAETFGAIVLDSIDELPDSSADLILLLDTSWGGEDAFCSGIRSAAELLSTEGEILAILPCDVRGSQIQILWSDGTSADPEALSKRLATVHQHCFLGLEYEEFSKDGFVGMAPAFLKRHREFFGKNVRDLYLDRVSESDFYPATVRGAGSGALLLAWGPKDAPHLSKHRPGSA